MTFHFTIPVDEISHHVPNYTGSAFEFKADLDLNLHIASDVYGFHIAKYSGTHYAVFHSEENLERFVEGVIVNKENLKTKVFTGSLGDLYSILSESTYKDTDYKIFRIKDKIFISAIVEIILLLKLSQ